MSMLTPPGMGGKYRIKGDAYPRMRRPRKRGRLVLALVGAVVALGLIGWGTVQLIDVFGGGGGKAKAAAHAKNCPAPAASGSGAPQALPKPAQITVNVYNATPRGGLAKSVADELKKRGFAIGKVGNAPTEYDKKVANNGVLLGAPTAARGPFSVLGTQLAGTTQKTDTRDTPDVDLILGNTFANLNTPKDADTALAALAKPAPAPSGKC
ncbi:LytR C-terminal domain-containing protein [Streptomyces xanthochromogenes]|uniref:Membrane protein n=1 Tax=Streptomyces xanthochromogenes TaxID=67384 RepID=A0ABQ3AEL1_9ACTN|nr:MULTISPECIES: LytR C-terminal domain-containing protein [Streptomyces]MYV88955.1 LytR family transcriptional regulator [Streptomyces sp. SID1034]GGY49975.1 membrane protein [Streptomyces xanthochromogenes]GHB58946.1 membrane protein [Streptomyces xanthochromogenes]